MPEKIPAHSQLSTAELPPAGFWRRGFALLIDGLLLAVPLYWAAYALSHDFDRNAVNQPDVPETAFHIFRVGLVWLYFSLLESSAMQATLGKHWLGLKVVSETGRRLTFTETTLRYFTKVISVTLLGLGCAFVFFTKRKQAFHDLVAASEVLKTVPKTQKNRTTH